MQEISFQVILKAVFGLNDGLRYEKLKEILIAILNPKRPILRAMLLFFPLLRQDLGPRSPWGSYVRLRQEMDDLIYAEIQERRSLADQ
ncbi:MAG: cytochrome P450, partial [Nostoc sp.]